MFRLYELYSLYTQKKMFSTRYGSPTTWCLCEKLPRSILLIAPTPELWCEVCGRRRRPRACFSSSSDEEPADPPQPEQQRLQETQHNVLPQKMSMVAKKQKPPCSSGNCKKCGRQFKPSKSFSQKLQLKNSCKMYKGRFCHYPKPQRLQAQRRDKKIANEVDTETEPTAPPSPPPSISPPVNESDSVWEPSSKHMPKLVAYANEVFNRPPHRRNRQLENQFISDLSPLDKPITDVVGGAISKQPSAKRSLYSHYSRPLPPLSHVLSDIINKHKVRAKGGGLPAKQDASSDSGAASQFSPFDSYEGPSEDALVVESARRMLLLPNALHIECRNDLPTNRLDTFHAEPSSDNSISSAHSEMPTAPPAERQLMHDMMHDMMKTVAQSGLSDSSASSSSKGSNSNKSDSSTQPVAEASFRTCGGEDIAKPEDVDMEPMPIMEKLLWLIDQHPTVDAAPDSSLSLTETDVKVKSGEVLDSQSESVKALLQLVTKLSIDGSHSKEIPSTILKSDIGNKLGTSRDSPQPELHISNDMSNEFHLNSTNKSAGDAKYTNAFVNGNHSKCSDKKQKIPLSANGGTSTSIWSTVTGFFRTKHSTEKFCPAVSLPAEELKPLKTGENLRYGTINQVDEEKHMCRGKKSTKRIIPNCNVTSCQKCGLHRGIKVESLKKYIFHSSASKSHQIAKLAVYDTPKISVNEIEKIKPITKKSEEILGLKTKKQTRYIKDSNDLHNFENISSFHRNTNIDSLESGTSSTVFESCVGNVGISAPLSKLPNVLQMANTTETLSFECSEIIKPKMISVAIEMGHVRYSTLTTLSLNKSYNLEFRTPDIREVQSSQLKKKEVNIFEHSALSQSSGYSKVVISENNKKSALKLHKLPVWPTHPSRQRKRRIKKITSKSIQVKCKKREEKDIWIYNELIQNKIHEMMTKPIRLLN